MCDLFIFVDGKYILISDVHIIKCDSDLGTLEDYIQELEDRYDDGYGDGYEDRWQDGYDNGLEDTDE